LGGLVKDGICGQEHLDLESDPLQIHQAIINNEELSTGRASRRPRDLPRETVIRDPEVRARYVEHLQDVRDICDAYKNKLDELLGDYVAELGRLADHLVENVARQDFQASMETMHSLLGISGEAGAGALYRLARRTYVPMVEERRWPQAVGWENHIHGLALQTQVALRAYGTVQSRGPAG
ncbi:MAG: hypothetical protein EON92_08660, partial [Burkholderiales bacterium]